MVAAQCCACGELIRWGRSEVRRRSSNQKKSQPVQECEIRESERQEGLQVTTTRRKPLASTIHKSDQSDLWMLGSDS